MIAPPPSGSTLAEAEAPPAQRSAAVQTLLVLLGVLAAVCVAIGASYLFAFVDIAHTMAGFFLYLVLAPATFFVALISLIAVAGLARSPGVKVVAGIYFGCAMALAVAIYFVDNPRVKAVLHALDPSRPAAKAEPGPLSPPRDSTGRTAGAEWAYSNGVTDEAVCNKARDREFREACAHVARRQNPGVSRP
jgi:hypothetical protein